MNWYVRTRQNDYYYIIHVSTPCESDIHMQCLNLVCHMTVIWQLNHMTVKRWLNNHYEMGVEHTAALSGSELSPSPSDNIRESWGWTRGMEGRNRREGNTRGGRERLKEAKGGREGRDEKEGKEGKDGNEEEQYIGGMEGMQNNAADSPWLS